LGKSNILKVKKRLFHFISNHRQNWLIKKIDRLAVSYHRAYENANHHIDSNGERRVIENLSAYDFKVIFDVGANVGEWSKEAVNFFSMANIYAFEPIPEVFEKMAKAHLPNTNVIPNNIGLSDKSEEITFNYFPSGNVFTSRYDVQGKGQVKKQKVKLLKGSEFAIENKIDQIDFLKIDTEGSDYLVLKGLEDYLQNRKIRVIQFEYNLNNILSKFLLRDFYELLNKYGYEIGKVYPKSVEFKPYNSKMEDFIGLNYLAIHKSDKELIEELS
jgi:FkbM family methyltransferase